jgi:hypothetical protein
MKYRVREAFIPKDAKWYIAEIIQDFRFEDGSESLVHINFVLVRADSPEEAYSNALALGKDGEISYKNTDGVGVNVAFRGLHDLNIIHDELEHGAEILYERRLSGTWRGMPRYGGSKLQSKSLEKIRHRIQE